MLLHLEVPKIGFQMLNPLDCILLVYISGKKSAYKGQVASDWVGMFNYKYAKDKISNLMYGICTRRIFLTIC